GLETVPQDATYLLKQGERVLSPPQNRALTDFLDTSASAEGSGRVTIGSLTIHVLENATSAQSLLNMDPAELRRVVAEKLIPALDVLARDGIRPELARSNP
ncbi:MAG: hypothetical protein OEW39_16700, partial [Deltaproteobacteria bacterium]|nr:hypothetical protein [Deltaproteobacteria bacterium]